MLASSALRHLASLCMWTSTMPSWLKQLSVHKPGDQCCTNCSRVCNFKPEVRCLKADCAQQTTVLVNTRCAQHLVYLKARLLQELIDCRESIMQPMLPDLSTAPVQRDYSCIKLTAKLRSRYRKTLLLKHHKHTRICKQPAICLKSFFTLTNCLASSIMGTLCVTEG